MANNIQLSIAVHLLAGLACKGGDGATSGYLAESVNTSPSFVRRTLAKLSKAGLVKPPPARRARAGWPRTRRIFRCWTFTRRWMREGVCHPQLCRAGDLFRKLPHQNRTRKGIGENPESDEASLAEISLAQIVSDVEEKVNLYSLLLLCQ